MLAGGDAFQYLDADAALEQVVENDESFQEVAAEASTSWTVSRSPSRRSDSALSSAGRSSVASLPLGVLLVGADPDQAE
ncbi:hypothetical protein [Actinomadura sp. NTSP31]|uniref:hypothetical protein n=1 Tax=Actinomadura sp. NTSP31 TaxID=1735447 RepID=UPI0035C0AE42